MTLTDATPRPLPQRLEHHTRPALREIHGYIPDDGPHGFDLLQWLIGKTAYCTLPDLGGFDALWRFLPEKSLIGLWSGGWVAHGEYRLKYYGDRLDAYMSVRKGNQYGIIINAYRLLGAHNDTQAIVRGIEGAIRLFDRNSLPYGDLRTPGNVAALIMTAYAGKSHLPPPEHLQMHWNAYRGARFEVATLGAIPECYDYDISSAYPSHMMRLPSTLPMEWRFTDEIRDTLHSDYAAALCDVEVSPDVARSPLAVRCGDQGLFYPVGSVQAVFLSQPELQLLAGSPAVSSIRVRRASIGNRIRARVSSPYNDTTRRLYRLRASLIGPYAKQVMVCMYGKLVGSQNGTANSHWNPVYASHITAALRMQTYQMSEQAYGEFADGIACAEPLPTTPGIGGVREEGRGPMLLVTDIFKQSDWKRPFANLRGYMEEQREASTVTVPVRRRVGIGSIAQGYNSAGELGASVETPYQFGIGSTIRVCDVPGLQNYDLLDGMIETRPPTMADIPGLMLARSLSGPRIQEFVQW